MKKSTLNVPPILWFWPKLKLYLKISHFPGFVGYNPVSSYYMSLLLLLSIVVWRSYSHFSVQLASGLFWVALRLVHISSSAHWHISPPGFLDLYLQILLRLMRQECELLATKRQNIKADQYIHRKRTTSAFLAAIAWQAKLRSSLQDRK